MISDETVKWIMGGLIGVPWPEGNPEICRAAARYWRKVSAVMAECELANERSTGVIVEAGQAGTAISSFHDLTEDVLPRLGRLKIATERLAKSLEDFATMLEQAQNEFRHMAWRTAVDIGVTIAFGVITVGLASAATTLYLSGVFLRAAMLFGGYTRAALALKYATYYVVDSLAYAAVDAGALAAVDLAHGRSKTTWGDFGRTFAANIAFNGVLDAQGAGVTRFISAAAAENIWTRGTMRLIASSVGYTPVDNMLQGKAIANWLPNGNEMEVKAAIHYGRVGSTELGREIWREYGRNWTKALFKLK